MAAREPVRSAVREIIRVEPGDWADYAGLARFHYAAGRPRACVAILRAVDPASELVAGVLVVSMPVLNAWWRRPAWGDRYERSGLGGAAGAARRLNAEVRTITRVIVEPRFRGLGVASALVRAYLANPRTSRTEAVAAMACFSPFFEAAGMTPVPQRPAPVPFMQDQERCWRLVDVGPARRQLRASAALRCALRAWARGGKGTRRLAPGPLAPLLRRAVQRALAPPRAFVAERAGTGIAGTVGVVWVGRVAS